MIYLKQSTASQEVILGPFVDSTDGVTAETALSIANTDIKVYKAGTTTSANKNSGGATHDAGGRYSIVLDATDTNTLGSGVIHVSMAGALPVKAEFCVLAANVYDAMIGGGDLLQVDTNEITGTAAQAIGIVDSGTAQSATSTTLVLRAAVAFVDDALVGATILQTGGTNSPQVARITGYVGASDTATVAAWPNGTPGGTITYVIIGTTPDSGGSGGSSAATIAAAVWNSVRSSFTTAGTFGQGVASVQGAVNSVAAVSSGAITAASFAANSLTAAALATDAVTEIQSGLATAAALSAVQADTDNIQTRLPGSLVGGRMDVSVGAMGTNVLTADALASDAVTEIQTGLIGGGAGLDAAGVRAAIGMALANLDTQFTTLLNAVGTVSSKTNQITFDNGFVTASVKRVGTDTLVPGGAGTRGYGS
jgi:hypothetical protein